MRVILILLGLLLMIGGAAVAGAQFAPPDLLQILNNAPPQAREFLQSQSALYAGAGGAGLGLLLMIIAAVTGGKKKAKESPVGIQGGTVPSSNHDVVPPVKLALVEAAPQQSAVQDPARPPPSFTAAPAPTPAPPKPKPQASAQPPASAQVEPATSGRLSMVDTVRTNPRLHNRKRVSDLVTLNDALKAYFDKHGAYPAVSGLGGIVERGAAWIPGLAPEFVPELPRDPAMTTEPGGPQYVYASDGKDYKLLAQNVSLAGGTSVEVLGVKIDHTRQPTAENASFGFWTHGFATV